MQGERQEAGLEATTSRRSETAVTVAVIVTIARLILSQGTPTSAMLDDPVK